MISDVPVGAYLSGGYDSSVIASIANDLGQQNELIGFKKVFKIWPNFDESKICKRTCKKRKFEIKELEITDQDFIDNIQKVIYHLDHPTAGPGSFSQYTVFFSCKKIER